MSKLLAEIRGKQSELYHGIAYGAYDKDESQNFIKVLDSLGLETKFQPVKVFQDGNKKANYDIAMAIDAIRYMNRVDIVALVTADGDFKPLVEYLQSFGLYVAVFGINVSRDLKEAANYYFEIPESMMYERKANETTVLSNA